MIFAHHFVEYDKMNEMLVKNKIEFYSFTPRHLRPMSIILKGIKGNISQEMENELVEKELNKFQIIEVVKINYNKDDLNRYHFLVQISGNPSLKELTNIKYIGYQKTR